MDRTEQKIKKETEKLNNTENQFNLKDIEIILYPTRAEYTFFSSTGGTSPRIDHMLGHKTHLNNFKRADLLQRIFFNHNGMKCEINNPRENWKIHMWKLTVITNQWVKLEITAKLVP